MMKMIFFWNFLIILMILIIFIFMSNYLHPITLLTLLLSYIMIICIKMSLNKFNYIYSILMFLIMISGLLVLFLYFTSLIANEKNKFTFNPLILTMFTINLIILLILLKYNFFNFLNSPSITLENTPSTLLNINLFNNIIKIYMYPYNNLSLMCMFFLLISLFLIIKTCTIKSSSLRKIT
uniref:NADH dehydrogenase subunit 6 n=1 Tax=Carebara diversa TaxID=615681 RepID=UPI001EE0037C|nr:NADH dehydrogenase subunit 6 [Carebara diversa]UIO59241.1 NADH dehydrogenase subunit 6 [Carebara diversa]